MYSKHFVMLCLLMVWASVPLLAQVPVAGFKVDGTTVTQGQTFQVCIGSSVQFASAATNANDFDWRFEGGTPSASANLNPFVKYNTAGLFKAVQAVAFVAGGVQDSTWVFIQVNNNFPKASFSVSPTTLQCGSVNFQFTSNSTGSGLTYAWDFDDAGTSTLQNPAHSFTKATGNSGTTTYDVRLTVTNSAGCSQDTIIPVEVRRIPDGKIGTSDATVLYGTFNGENTFKKCDNIPSYRFTFINQSTTISTNNSYSIKWGDGSPDSNFTSWPAANPISHLYKLGSSYLTLTVKSSSGCQSQRVYSIFLGSNPAAGFASLGNTQICAPDSQRFVISGVGNNAPGTFYTLSVNDQSPSVTMLHPPKDTVSHTFDMSSCGIFSGNGTQTFNNSFRASLKAENPCGSTSVSVIPIYVSGKPNPEIGIPTPNVCINTNLAITNTGDYGGVITPTGSGSASCANSGKQVWKITPATGFTIVNGSLGSLNNSLDGNLWTDGGKGLELRFSVTGTYKVKLYLYNNRCGMDSSEEETICVRLPPTASYTLDKHTFCGPGTVKATNTSPVGACGGDLYNWAIRYDDAQACSGVNGASFINGTNANTTNAEINFATPGRYIIELTVIAKGGTCPTPVFRDTVFVKGKPAVAINPLAAICGGTALTPNAAVSACYGSSALTYAWAFTNGTPATSSNLIAGNIAYALAGTHPISLSVTNECGTTLATASALVNAKPVITNIANKPICSGVDVQLPLTGSVAGTQFTWTSTLISGVASGFTSSGGYVTATSINDILENTGATAAVVEYRIKAQGPAPSLCVSNEMVVQVTVSSGVEASNAGIDQYLCNLSSAQLDANSPAIGTGTWKQVSGPAATIANTANAKTNVTGLVGNNVYVFEWTITGSSGACAISTDAVSIFNRPTLTVPNAGKDTGFCAASGSSIHLQANTLRPFETGTWRIIANTTGGTPVFADINSPTTLVSDLTLGNLTFGWLVSNDAGCTPIEDQVVVSVDDGPETANAGKDQLICAATQATMSAVNPVAGAGKWTQVSGPAAVITTPASATSTVTGLTPGSTYVFRWTVTAPNATCGSTFDDMAVEVRPPLTLPNAGPDSSFCGGGLSSYNLNGNTLRPFETGTWSVIFASAGTPQLSDPNYPKAVLSDLLVGTVRVEWRVTNDLNCGSIADTVELLVGDGPVPAKAGVDQFLCATNQISLSGNIPAVGSGLWTETSGLGAVIASPTSASTLVTGIVPGNNYTFRWTVTAANPACGSNGDDADMVVRLPISQADAGKDANLCAAGGSSYILQGNTLKTFETGTWQIISFTTAGLPAISNANDPGATLSNLSTGNVRLQWSITNDLNCKPTLDTVSITVGSGSIQSDAGPDQKLCTVPQAFLNGNLPSSGSGLWSQDSGPAATIANAGNSSTLITGLVPGDYTFRWTVTASNPICGSSFDVVSIIVRPPITQPDAGKDESLCDGSSTSLTLQGNTPKSFETGTWKIISFTTAGLPSFSNVNDPNAVLSNLSLGTVRLQWSITNDVGCAPLADTMNIIIGAGSTPADAGSDQKLCDVTQTLLSGNIPPAGSGLWSQDSGPAATITDPTNSSTTVTGLVSGTYVFRWTITASVTTCGSSFDVVTVIIRPPNTLPNAGKDSSFCAASASTFTLQGNTLKPFETGTWQVISFTTANKPIISDINNPKAILSSLSVGTVRLQWSVTNDASCPKISDTVTLQISDGPLAADAGSDQTICNTTQAFLSGSLPSSGAGLWKQVSGATATIADAASATTTVSGLVPGKYVFRWTVTAANPACGSTADDVEIAVRPAVTQPNAGKDSSICSTSSLVYTLQGNSYGAFETGTWKIISFTTAGRPVISDINNPKAELSNLSVGNVRLEWVMTNDVGCAPLADTVSISIGVGPVTADAGADQIICAANQVSLSGNAPSSGTGLWTQVNGTATTIVNPTDASTSVAGLIPGNTYTFRWTTTAALAVCGSSSDNVIVTVRPPITIPDAGKDSTVCAATVSNYTLQGNVVRPFETASWKLISYTSSTKPVISDILKPNAVLSNISVGKLRLEWRVSNDLGCAQLADTVDLFFADGPQQAAAGNDQQLCNQPTTQLTATTAKTGFLGSWEVIAPTTQTLADLQDAATIISGLPIGKTPLVWTVTNNICPTTYDTVIINVYPPVANTISGTQTICNGQPATIVGNAATGGDGSYKYQWQTSTNNNLFTGLESDTLVSLQQLPSTTTWYRRSVASGPCTSFSDTVLVTVQPPITNNKISASQQVCVGNSAKNITGTLPAGGDGNFNYSWQQSVDSGKIWTLIRAANQKDFSPGVINQTTFYRRLVNSSFCTGAQGDTSLPISVTINPDAVAIFAPTLQTACAPFVLNGEIINVTSYPVSNTGYRWYVNDSLIGAGNNFPGYILKQAGDSITLKMVAVSRYGCKNDSLTFLFTTLPQPKPAFTLSDSVGCGPLTIQFTNTTPDTAQFKFAWDFGNGKTSNLAQPAPVFFDINPNYGDTVYAVKMSAFNECDTVAATHFIRVRAKAKALIALDKTSGCSPMEVTLSNVSRGSQASYKWDFGDSTPELISNDLTVKHIYNTDVLDTFYVKLYSSNDCGKDTQQYAIVVNPGLIAINVNINGNQINGCLPHTVMFVNNTKGANLFKWNFGDGSAELATTKGVDTVIHTYNITGTFTIKLSATNSCSDTVATEMVTVQEKPTASFTPVPAIACVGQEIKMTNTSTPDITYNWNFGHGSNSNLFEPTKKYTAPGSYRILLVASRAFPQGLSCIDSAVHTVVINDSLPGSFAVNGLENCAPFAVTFINNDKPATSTIWDFGDGEIGSGDSLVHTYTIPGQYFVKMVSKSIEGCVLTASQTITVTGPVGVLNYKSGPACLGETLSFSAVANNANSYRFYFGNGDSITSNIPNVTYTYARAGNYLPSVLLISGNCTKLIYGTDSIWVDKVSAGFNYTSVQTCGVTTYQFTDTSGANSGVVLRNWDFGDGTTATTANPVKKYTATGLYNVHLKVTSNNGCTDTLTVPLAVQVWAVPKATIESDSLACIADMVSFAANVQSVDPITSNNWDFGNGLQGTGATANSNYSQGGLYTITLVSTTNLGCADTATKTIRISVAPLINAGNNVRICLGQTANLNASGGTVYQWTPTTGLSCSNCANPIAKPIITTQYIVTGRNQFSCPKNDTIEVEVIQPFTISTSGNDTLCLGDSRQISAAGAFSYVWTPTAGLNSATIQNPLATPSITNTYKVIGYDNYNCFTDTSYLTMAVGQMPTVDAGIGSTVPAGTEVRLQPRVNNGPFNRYIWTPQIDLSCYNCLSPVATVNSNITYRLEVENNYNCVASDTISFKVICNKDAQLFIPNAFSPDGDGINDILMVRGKGIAQVKIFRVFNRYGQIVYEKGNFSANDPQFGWDGKIRGVPAANEVYIVTAEAICGGGELFKYKGNVTLFR